MYGSTSLPQLGSLGSLLYSSCFQVYDSVTSLRYGHLMIMTDQDHDGSHIKGLIMNFMHSFFPSLLKIPGFMLEFITPIVKVCICEVIEGILLPTWYPDVPV